MVTFLFLFSQMSDYRHFSNSLASALTD